MVGQHDADHVGEVVVELGGCRPPPDRHLHGLGARDDAHGDLRPRGVGRDAGRSHEHDDGEGRGVVLAAGGEEHRLVPQRDQGEPHQDGQHRGRPHAVGEQQGRPGAEVPGVEGDVDDGPAGSGGERQPVGEGRQGDRAWSQPVAEARDGRPVPASQGTRSTAEPHALPQHGPGDGLDERHGGGPPVGDTPGHPRGPHDQDPAADPQPDLQQVEQVGRRRGTEATVDPVDAGEADAVVVRQRPELGQVVVRLLGGHQAHAPGNLPLRFAASWAAPTECGRGPSMGQAGVA